MLMYHHRRAERCRFFLPIASAMLTLCILVVTTHISVDVSAHRRLPVVGPIFSGYLKNSNDITCFCELRKIQNDEGHNVPGFSFKEGLSKTSKGIDLTHAEVSKKPGSDTKFTIKQMGGNEFCFESFERSNKKQERDTWVDAILSYKNAAFNKAVSRNQGMFDRVRQIQIDLAMSRAE